MALPQILDDMKKFKKEILSILMTIGILTLSACSSSDDVDYTPSVITPSDHPNDVYIRENMLDKYGAAIRWRWDDRFLQKGQLASAIDEDLVIPVTQLIENLWIQPFIVLSDDSEAFIKRLIPKEIIYIGSYIYNDDGARLAGFADGGTRVSLLNLNALDMSDRMWIEEQLITMHHEFNHIVHQNHGIPSGFNTVSSNGYLGQGWNNGVSLSDAIIRGMVSAYGTSNEYEDFSELVSRFLVQDEETFNSLYLIDSDCSIFADEVFCTDLNNGRELIRQKLQMVKDFYLENFNINLNDLRDTIQSRMPI